MNLAQFEYLVAVVDKGSYARASKSLYVTPQAMSKAVNDMERELGIELFVRSGRHIKPTDAALRIVEHARLALSASYDIKLTADLLRNETPSRRGAEPALALRMPDPNFAD